MRLEADGDDPKGDELDAIERALTQAQANEPTSARWVYGLGLVAAARMNAQTEQEARYAQQAIFRAKIEQAIKLDPKVAQYEYMLGQAIMAGLRRDDGMMTMAAKAGKAKDAWQRAIKLDENHVRSLVSLAFYEIQARKQGGTLFGSYKDAKKLGERVLAAPGGAFQGHLVLGQIAAEQEKWDDMTAHYTAALTAQGIDADPARARYALASALLNNKKDPAAAMPIIDALIAQAKPDDYSAFFLRASAKKAQGDCPGAVSDFTVVLEKNPQAQNSRFFIAECYEAMGDAPSAIKHYEEFASRFPSDGRADKATKAVKKLKKKLGGAKG